MEQRTFGLTGRKAGISGSAPGRSAPTGARSPRTTRWRRCTPRWTPASRSSTPPTSTATGARERLVGRLLRERGGERAVRGDEDGPPRRADRPENYTPRALPRLERPLAREPRRRHARPRPAALPADRSLLPPARCSTPRRAGRARGGSRDYGVSVERVEEALKAIEYPGVATVQIIFNAFRQRPPSVFFAAAAQARRRRSSRACRWPPACCRARYDRDDDLRRRRPPQLQPPRRGVRRRRDVRGRAVRGRPGRRSRRCARSCPRARRWRSSRCAGSSTSRGVSTVIPGARIARAGARQRRGGRARAADDEQLAARARRLRRARARVRARPLVDPRAQRADDPEPMSGPISVIDGRFQLGERLHGAEGLGVWEGTEPGEGDRPVLVSIGPHGGRRLRRAAARRPRRAHAARRRRRAGRPHRRGRGASARRDRRPAPEEAAALGAEVAEIAAFVHHMGLVLGGIRPESVWRGDEVSISPRLTRLWELSRESLDAGRPVGLHLARAAARQRPDAAGRRLRARRDDRLVGDRPPRVRGRDARGADPRDPRSPPARVDRRSGAGADRRRGTAAARGPAEHGAARGQAQRAQLSGGPDLSIIVSDSVPWAESETIGHGGEAPRESADPGLERALGRRARRRVARRPSVGGRSTGADAGVGGKEQSWGRSLSGDRGRGDVIAICDEDLP